MGFSFPSLRSDTFQKVSSEAKIWRLSEGWAAAAYNEFRNDPELQEWALEDGQNAQELDYTWELMEGLGFVWGVFLGGKLFAVFRFHRRGLQHFECYVSAKKTVRGRMMMEWARTVYALLKQEMGLKHLVVSATVVEGNKGCRWFCLRNGFKMTGVIPQAFIKNGQYWFKIIYTLEIT
jgi:hypothetical protein